MGTVVNTGIKTQFIDRIGAFFRATCNTHNTAAACLGQCTKGTAHRACRCTDHHRFSGLGVDDLDQPIPRRHAGHANGSQVVRQWHVRGIHLAQHARGVAIHHAVQLPAAHTDDLVPWLELGMAAFHHLTHRTAEHDFAQRLGRGIALAVIHAATHIGVQTQVMVTHQHLAFLQGRSFRFHQLEVADSSFALRTVVQQNLLIARHVYLLYL